MFSVRDKKILITGASGGIGIALVEAFHKNGAKIVASGTNQDKLSDLKSKFNNEIEIIACNLSDASQTESLVSKASEILGGLDILICNAGVTNDKLSMKMTREDFGQVIDINLTSSFILNKEACKIMSKNKFGRIINISSIVAVTGNPGQANYVASKAGMIGLSKSMALEYAKRNITVNNIAPGFIETPMTEKLNDAQREAISVKIPMAKMGSPEDISNAALFLASEEAGYITGQTIHVNGGMAMI